jgi:hypothetical protein
MFIHNFKRSTTETTINRLWNRKFKLWRQQNNIHRRQQLCPVSSRGECALECAIREILWPEIKTYWYRPQRMLRQAFWNCLDFLGRRDLLFASVKIERLDRDHVETNQDPQAYKLNKKSFSISFNETNFIIILNI